MAAKQKGPANAPSARASVSFPRELYETLERIAKEKKVSVAWIVRDAAEQYVATRWPILAAQTERKGGM